MHKDLDDYFQKFDLYSVRVSLRNPSLLQMH